MDGSEIANIDTPKTTETSSVSTPKSSDKWLKIVLFLKEKTSKTSLLGVFGLVIATGLVYAGYWYGSQQTQPVEKPPSVSQPIPTPTPTLSPTSPPLDRTSCKQAGGKWGIWRDKPNAAPECNLPTSDAGKECTDSSQCKSYCQAEEGAERGDQVSGRCYGWKLVYTCMREVREGVVDEKWCY